MVGKLKKLNYKVNELGEPIVIQYNYTVQQCRPNNARKLNLFVDFKAADAFNTDLIDHLQRENFLCWDLEMTDQGIRRFFKEEWVETMATILFLLLKHKWKPFILKDASYKMAVTVSQNSFS